MLALLQPDGTITLKNMEFNLGSLNSGDSDRKYGPFEIKSVRLTGNSKNTCSYRSVGPAIQFCFVAVYAWR